MRLVLLRATKEINGQSARGSESLSENIFEERNETEKKGNETFEKIF